MIQFIRLSSKTSSFCSILNTVTSILVGAITSFGQVSSPASIVFRPLAVGKEQKVINPNYPNQTYQSPIGMTAEDVQRQVNQNAMKSIGYQSPQIPPSDPTACHQFILEQARQTNQSKAARQIAEIREILAESIPSIEEEMNYEKQLKTQYYKLALRELMLMQNDSLPFSIKRSVFLIENAWNDNAMKYEDFCALVSSKVSALHYLMKQEGINPENNLGKNYVIQKLFTEKVIEYRSGKVYKVHQPLKYDFVDFRGESDWSKMFVSKLLKTGMGQCHSLPLLYLILAEEIQAKVWLSMAPEHSFIIFAENDNRTFYNYETTNGSVVNPDWLMESGYINTTSIRNRIYLDTLSRNGLMATLLADLIMGYTGKFGYDSFTASMIDSLLQIYPGSLQGQMFRADLLVIKAKESIRIAGNPPLEQLNLYPDAYSHYMALLRQYDYIDNLGYMPMPKNMYEKWLESLNVERRKQEREQLLEEIKAHAKANR